MVFITGGACSDNKPWPALGSWLPLGSSADRKGRDRAGDVNFTSQNPGKPESGVPWTPRASAQSFCSFQPLICLDHTASVMRRVTGSQAGLAFFSAHVTSEHTKHTHWALPQGLVTTSEHKCKAPETHHSATWACLPC